MKLIIECLKYGFTNVLLTSSKMPNCGNLKIKMVAKVSPKKAACVCLNGRVSECGSVRPDRLSRLRQTEGRINVVFTVD